jgi:hypothetical protein
VAAGPSPLHRYAFVSWLATICLRQALLCDAWAHTIAHSRALAIGGGRVSCCGPLGPAREGLQHQRPASIWCGAAAGAGATAGSVCCVCCCSAAVAATMVASAGTAAAAGADISGCQCCSHCSTLAAGLGGATQQLRLMQCSAVQCSAVQCRGLRSFVKRRCPCLNMSLERYCCCCTAHVWCCASTFRVSLSSACLANAAAAPASCAGQGGGDRRGMPGC